MESILENIMESKYFRKIGNFHAHKNGITVISWCPNGSWLATCGMDSTVKLWSLNGEEILYRFARGGLGGPGTCLAWSPDGRYLACGSKSGVVCVWETNGFQAVKLGGISVGVSGSSIRCLSWGYRQAEAAQCLAFSGEDRIVNFIDFSGEDEIEYEKGIGHVESIRSLAFGPGGDIVVTGTDKGTIGVWRPFEPELKSGMKGNSLDRSYISIQHEAALAWLADRGMLGSQTSEGVRFQLLRNLLTRYGILAHKGSVNSLDWCITCNILASGGDDGYLRLWDVESGMMKNQYNSNERIFCLKFAYHGRIILLQTINHLIVLRTNPLTEIVRYTFPAVSDGSRSEIFTAPLAAGNESGLATVDPGDHSVIMAWLVDYESLFSKALITKRPYQAVVAACFGERGWGRSNLCRAIAGLNFNQRHEKDDFNIHGYKLDAVVNENEGIERKREIFLWDLPSNPNHAMTQHVFSGNGNVLILALRPISGSNATDSENIARWRPALRKFLAGIEGFTGEYFVVITCCDELNSQEVDASSIDFIKTALGVKHLHVVSAMFRSGLRRLRAALVETIQWQHASVFHSIEIFDRLLDIVRKFKDRGRYLVSMSEMYSCFVNENRFVSEDIDSYSDRAFVNGIRLMEAQGKVFYFDHGDDVLLEPNYYRTYAAAMIEGARRDSAGMGRLPLEQARSGYGPAMEISQADRISDRHQQSRLLSHTVKEVIEQRVAQEVCTHGVSYLVFPRSLERKLDASQITSEICARYRFRGDVDKIFSALVVSLLGLREFFYPDNELWQNAAQFNPRSGGSCGVFAESVSDGESGEFAIFFRENTTMDDQVSFVEIISKHIENYYPECIQQLQESVGADLHAITGDSSSVEGVQGDNSLPQDGIEVFCMLPGEGSTGFARYDFENISKMLNIRGVKIVSDIEAGLSEDEREKMLRQYKVALVLLSTQVTDELRGDDFQVLKSSGCRLIPVLLPSVPTEFSMPVALNKWKPVDWRRILLRPEHYDSLAKTIGAAWEKGRIDSSKFKGHVFVSCLADDYPRVSNLINDIKAAGHNVWCAHGETKHPGVNINNLAKSAIKDSYAFILCISDRLERKRSNVNSEIKLAIEIQRKILSEKVFVIPVRLENCTIPDESIDDTRSLADLTPFDYFVSKTDITYLVETLNKNRQEAID